MVKILIIDDEAAIRSLLRRRLEDQGFEIIELEDGRAASTVCEVQCPDIVVTDIYMRLCDGLETIRELRATYPALNIIAISGGGISYKENFLEIAGHMGASATFSKPLNWPEFMSKVNELAALNGPKVHYAQ